VQQLAGRLRHLVHVQQLMGIGTRYDLAGRAGSRVSVVVHKDGHRELYVF